MTSRAFRFAVNAVRAWTRAYTWRLPTALRDARRAEIDSDLWELQHDRSGTRMHPALQVLLRLLLGVADDLSWRSAHTSYGGMRLKHAAVVAAAALLLAGLWVVSISLPSLLPDPPATPFRNGPRGFGAYAGPDPAPPPPPPPPPPLPRPGPRAAASNHQR